MNEITFRLPTVDDWPAILTLAELSLSELPNAHSQQEWLKNRKSFTPSDGIQQHFVATSGERIVGYAGAERRNEFAEGGYRLFVVVAPYARATLGTMLLAKLRECLFSLGARRAWFQEDEAQKQFISYLEEHGFVQIERFRLDDGTWIIRLAMDAPFPIIGLA